MSVELCVSLCIVSQRPLTPPFLRKHKQKQSILHSSKATDAKSSVCQNKTPHLGQEELAGSSSGTSAVSSQQALDDKQQGSHEDHPPKPTSASDIEPVPSTPLSIHDVFGSSDSDANSGMEEEEMTHDMGVGQQKHTPTHMRSSKRVATSLAWGLLKFVDETLVCSQYSNNLVN